MKHLCKKEEIELGLQNQMPFIPSLAKDSGVYGEKCE